jgi:hypothetical protein
MLDDEKSGTELFYLVTLHGDFDRLDRGQSSSGRWRRGHGTGPAGSVMMGPSWPFAPALKLAAYWPSEVRLKMSPPPLTLAGPPPAAPEVCCIHGMVPDEEPNPGFAGRARSPK